MLPQLTAGAIHRILLGENVADAVVQILGCVKLGIRNDLYRLLISDGVTGYPFVMLGIQLIHMVTNNEMKKYTIVRVDKYVCNQGQFDRDVITLTGLTVLVAGDNVNKKLGNPVNSRPCSTTTGAENSVDEADCSEINAVTTYVSSVINGSIQSMMEMMFPELTKGAINRILNGENVPDAVMQVIGYEKIPGHGKVRYRFLISDGATASPFVLLGTQLNYMVVNKELEKFTIIQVKEYVCNVFADQKVIIFLRLSAVVPGNEVNEKLGKPVIQRSGRTSKGPATKATAENAVAVGNPVKASASCASKGPATKGTAENAVTVGNPVKASSSRESKGPATKAATVNGVAVAGRSKMNAVSSSERNGSAESMMSSQLTAGAIMRILEGEDVPNPVMQIVGCKENPGSGDDCYSVGIFDGAMAWPFTKLDTQLNHLVDNEEFLKFPVRVDKYVCNQVQFSPKEIVLLELTVLGPGNELKNPVNSSA